MKKIIALLLALMMALVCVSALADDPIVPTGDDPEVMEPSGDDTQSDDNGNTTQVVSIDPSTASGATGKPTVPVTVKIKKSISATPNDVYQASDRHPVVTLNFTAVQKSVELSTETVAPEVTFETLTIGENADEGDLEINLPSYKAVGIYTYTVTETPTNLAGMNDATNLELKVTVIQNTTTGDLEIAGIAVRQDNVKTDNIENVYKSGRLKVTKKVDGNMGDRNKEFPITITLNAPTGKTVASTVTYKINDTGNATAVTFNNGTAEVKVNLKHDDFVEIINIPEGVTYTVIEDEYDATSKKGILHNESDSQENPEIEYAYYVENEVKTAATITVADITEITITNTKSIIPDTGVTLDSAVYMLIMALAVAGFVALKIRRREDY